MIVAVVVAFNPKPERFAELLEALRGQVQRIVVVDNGQGVCAPGCEVMRQTGNAGLAAAQNAGIRAALASGASHVLLLDHDSVPDSGMVDALKAVLEAAAGRGDPAAAAGPVFMVGEPGIPSWFVRFGAFGVQRVRCPKGADAVEVDFLIASGTLVTTTALREVGLMDETLFIDHVDTDWCLRARAAGWRLYGACRGRLSHNLGEGVVRLAGRVVHFSHAPERNYYAFRNSLLLYRRTHATLSWIFGDILRLTRLACAELLFSSRRLAAVRAIIAGVVHGFAGRRGKRGVA